MSDAPDYEVLRSEFRQKARWYGRFLRPWLPPNKAAVLVDVPCGTGNLLYALKGLGYANSVGVDSDKNQVDVAKALDLPAHVEDAFVFLSSKPDSSVDAIFSLDFIEHVPPGEAVAFATLAHRKLRPGGHVLFRTPCADGPFGAADRYNDMTHKWALTSNAAVTFLLMAGFRKRDMRILDEAPVPYKWQNVIRRGLFELTTRVLTQVLNFSGIGAPRLWTRSMWLVAQRETQSPP